MVSGIRHGADVVRVQRLIESRLAATGKPELGFRLNEFSMLPQGELEHQQGLLNVRLAIEHLPVLNLQCQKITNQEVVFT